MSTQEPRVTGLVLHVDPAGILAVARLLGDGLRDAGREVGRLPGLVPGRLVRRH